MTYRDPYVVPDGPIARLAAKMLRYDGSLPSATFTPRERWKIGQTSTASLPSKHHMVHEGQAVEISSDTDFNGHSKHNPWKLNLNIRVDGVLFAEDVGYPHMQPPHPRDQRHLLLYRNEPIAISLLESLIGRPVRDLIDMPAWLDDVMGWRTIKAIACSDPVSLILDHQQWDQDLNPAA